MEEKEELTTVTEDAQPITTQDTEYADLVTECKGDHIEAMFKYCFNHNIFYDGGLLRSMILKTSGFAEQLPQSYIDILNANPRYDNQDFFSQLMRDNFEKIYNEDAKLSALDEETRKNRLAVIDILAYDPFKDDDIEDKPQLYRDMTGMLNEGMRKDVAKAKAALSVVRSYNNLEKYQKKINEIMKTGQVDDETQKQLDQLIKVQKTLQDSINTTAEKNNFTVKGIGVSGKGMLSDVLNQIEEKGIDEGITNFYDISTSKAIEEIANISFKAQLNQINLSKTDYADILIGQVAAVKEAQRKAKDAMEAARIAKEKLKKQKLLDELEADYRSKGIKESEIQEFIDREYHLYDGVD